ncbi:MFS transporter [Microbacterium sp. RD1]|uniref:MFS transporter n=1 Tax=Microbacterium sp. RD1 TaxID=3457313 RepID=UPI003FA60240
MTSIKRSYPDHRLSAPVLARLWVLALALFVVSTNAFVIAGVLPELAREFGTSTATVASSITWYAAVVAVASPLVATFLARVPRRALLTVGMGLVAAGTAVTALAGGMELFTAGRVLAALGGAALVPPATAAAPSLVEPRHRGRAIAIVAFGFAGAMAFGSPLGAGVAALAGWRVSLWAIAGLAVILTVVIGVTMTRIPQVAGARLRDRVAVLGDRRILLVLLSMVCFILSFNVLYVFSADVLAPALEEAPGVLAAVLLAFGVATLLGTWLGGQLVDRSGGLRATALGLLGMVAVYAALEGSTAFLPGAIALYAAWGLVGMSPQVGIQDLLVAAKPKEAGITLSWYSTAMYVGIALAPVVGGAALTLGPWAVPLAAMAAALLALAFVVGGRWRAQPA